MFKKTIVILLVGIAVAPACLGQQLSPPMPYAQRVELAKKLVETDRAAALANPSSPDRVTVFTKTYAMVDPAWTADFVLEHPIKGGENIAYENDVILRLLSSPMDLSDDQVLGFIRSSKFMGSYYAKMALKHLPDSPQHAVLKQSIIKAALPTKEQYTGPFRDDYLALARQSDEPQDLVAMRAIVDDYYQSGKAEEVWKKTQANPAHHNNLRYLSTSLRRDAPKDFDLGFMGEYKDTKSNSTDGRELHAIKSDASRTEEELAAWLATKTHFDFGGEFYEMQSDATSLGLLAKTHPDVARKWIASAPHQVARILAELCIAPAIVKQDRTAAIELVRGCFARLTEIDTDAPGNRRDNILLNMPLTKIAGIGLRVANHIDADLLDDCVDQTLVLLKKEKQDSNKFLALVRIARFDRGKAKQVFDVLGEEVQIGYSSEFFRALAAIDPAEVWAEYEDFVEVTKGDTNQYDLRIRTAIAPALAERRDDMFWNAIAGSTNTIPDELFTD